MANMAHAAIESLYVSESKGLLWVRIPLSPPIFGYKALSTLFRKALERLQVPAVCVPDCPLCEEAKQRIEWTLEAEHFFRNQARPLGR